ncbi:hypothetical protein GKR56_05315 [Providencia alcalifaciens]|uniref:hypothetical protein n=1 Tax=Providencia alcalifaciens TaxID=126385 RepID=UPI0012B66861|nr:hypothetical protein [Providencia alcalifaciens]MTC52671.1 hypothetical protein [Providencia alcalifaciens]
MDLNKTLYFTWYENKYSSNGCENGEIIHTNEHWHSIVEYILNKDIWLSFEASDTEEYQEAKEYFDGAIFAQMAEGKPRTNENIIKHYAIVIDIDGDYTVKYVKDKLKEYEYLLYSTGSQGLKVGDHFRVILPLLNPVSKDEYNSFSKSLESMFYYSDPSFCKRLQIQYLPRINKIYESVFISEYNPGVFFDISKLEKNQIIENEFNSDVFKKIENNYIYEVENKDEILALIIDENRWSLSYDEKLKLTSILKNAGYEKSDIIETIDLVRKLDSKNSGLDMYEKANTSYGSILSLRNFLPEKSKILLNTNAVINDFNSNYDFEYNLSEGQYLSDIIDDIKFKEGINLLIASTGIGKNHAMMKREKTKIITPLTSIVEQSGSNNDLYKNSIATWNQIKHLMDEPSECKQWDLVIDEAHGIIFDYDYKYETIETLQQAIKLFNKVIFMSGTIKPEYFSNIKFETISKVTKTDNTLKQIQTYFCKSKEDSIIRDLKNSERKSILLINDKVKGNYIGEQSGKKFILVNADLKNEENVKNLFSTGIMGDYDCIIGTNSIVEGLSIIDELDEVDIFICEETDPDRIEQFTNRFRKIKKLKNVNYYIDSNSIIKTNDNNIEKVIESAKELANALKKSFDNAQSNQQKNAFIENYHINNKFNVYIKNNDFYVNYNMIDYQSYVHRKEKSNNEFSYFMSRLFEYNFQIFLPIYDDYMSNANVDIKELKKIEKELTKENENKELIELKEYFEKGVTPVIKGDTFLKYKIKIQGMMDKGLNNNDIQHVIDSIIEDRDYENKLLKDIEYNKTNCQYRDFVISEVNCLKFSHKNFDYISSDDANTIATNVVRMVLSKEFDNDIDLMIKSSDWKSLISKKMSNGNNVSLNTSADPLDTFLVKNKMASSVIRKYISLSNSTKITRSNERIYAYKILHFSLTGIDLNHLNLND